MIELSIIYSLKFNIFFKSKEIMDSAVKECYKYLISIKDWINLFIPLFFNV